MTDNGSLLDRLIKAGWWQLHANDDGSRVTWYRWRSWTREELSINFDPSGRVECWSIWHNVRQGEPDQAAGRRGRLETFIGFSA